MESFKVNFGPCFIIKQIPFPKSSYFTIRKPGSTQNSNKMGKKDNSPKLFQLATMAHTNFQALHDKVQHKIAQSSTEDRNFETIVVGVGSMGAPTCYNLAKKGFKVLGLEQFDIPHQLGSHTGQSRLIRKAYFEHSDYVPLLKKAYDKWNDIESESGIQLYFPTGLIYFGKSEHLIINGIRQSAEKYDLSLHTLKKEAVKKRFPQFQVPDYYESIFEPEAGFISAEKAILVYTEQAIKHGAQIQTKEQVLSWKQVGPTIEVQTNKNIYQCQKLILTVGAWAGQLAPNHNHHLNVTRQVIAWFSPKRWEDFALGKFPCWFFAEPSGKGGFYGFPILSSSVFGAPLGLKFAYHYPGNSTHPDTVNREVSKEEIQYLLDFLQSILPSGYSSSPITTKTCFYTNSPDDHFILDFDPSNENVILATGFSGHGFKFASVIGAIIADLAINGSTDQPIGFLNAKRLQNQ